MPDESERLAIIDATLTDSLRQQRAVLAGLDALRERLFAELVALQKGEVTLHHANAAAALGRQIQQTAEVQARLLREVRREFLGPQDEQGELVDPDEAGDDNVD